jgi:hypothetical protein
MTHDISNDLPTENDSVDAQCKCDAGAAVPAEHSMLCPTRLRRAPESVNDRLFATPHVECIWAGLECSPAVRDRALRLAVRADRAPVNVSPRVLAAAAVYGATLLENEKCSQDAVAGAAGVSALAIRGCYRDVLAESGIEMGDGAPSPDDRSLGARLRSLVFGGGGGVDGA